MADITINPITIPDWKHGNGTFTVRVEPEKSFFASDGTLVAKNGYFTAIATAAGGVCVTEAIVVKSTTDALDDQNVRYKRAAIFKGSTRKETILENFQVPASLAPATTWGVLEGNTNGTVPYVDGETYPRSTVNALIADMTNNVINAKSAKTVFGLTKIDTVPQVLNNPIAVGINSPRVSFTSNSLSATNDLAEAVTNLSTLGGGTLVVKGDAVLSSSVDMPLTIELDFADKGNLTISGDAILTVRKMIPQGTRQLFNITSGHVRFARGAVNELNLAWWSGIDEWTNITPALTEAIFSLSYSNGGNLSIPNQYFEVREDPPPVPPHSHIYGAGAEATKIRLAGAFFAFKISDLCQYSSIRDLTIDGDGSGEGIFFEGDYPNSAKNINLENIHFKNLDKGVSISSASVIDWEAMNVNIIRPTFELCDDCIYIATINSGIHVFFPLFYPSVGGTAVRVMKVGSLHLIIPIAFGSAPVTPNVPPTDGSTFLKIEGQHNLITVTGGQEENFQYFIKTSGADYRQGIIRLQSSLIQSEINLPTDRSIISEGNTYVAIAQNGNDAVVGTFTDAVGSVSFIYSKGDYFENRRYGSPVILATNKTNKFVGGSTLIEHTDNITGTFTRSGFNRFILPAAFWGQGKPPVEILNDEGTGLLARFGEPDASGNFQNGYSFIRSTTDGHFEINGNQDFPYKGVRTNGYLTGELLKLSASGARPAASADTRGVIWLKKGGAGVADTFEVCVKTSADTYVWKTITIT